MGLDAPQAVFFTLGAYEFDIIWTMLKFSANFGPI